MAAVASRRGAFRAFYTTQGSTRVGLSWLNLEITLFEQDVSSCQNAVGYCPRSAQLHSGGFVSLMCSNPEQRERG